MNALRRNAGLIALAILVACLAACHRTNKDVVARVNGKDITRTELDRAYQQQILHAPQQPLDAADISAVKLGLLQNLIENEMLMQQAEKLGVLATDDEVNEKLTEAKAPYTSEEFAKILKDQGLTEDESKRQIRIALTLQKLVNKEVNSKISISDADISAYYNAHKAEFNLIEPVYQVARVLVVIGGDPEMPGQKPHSQAEALDKIRTVYNRLQSGEDFATIASKYSEDQQTRNTGGVLGVFPESSLKNVSQASREALMKMQPGQISSILPTVDTSTKQLIGYQILKLMAREPAGQRQLSDPATQQQIRAKLRNTREQLLRAAFLENLHDQAKVENYFAEEILRSIGAK
jgi:peptidyl-prolyl cis-trans isomerase SurA